jgi:branched-chain amino acid transport system substrate-binding protein
MRKRPVVTLLGALSLVLAACGGDSGSADAPDAINIGAVVPLTGPFAGGGAQVERGYRYAVEAINEAGGVYVEEYDMNLPLNLILMDDASDPAQTTSTMEELAEMEIVAYLGGFGSPVHAAGTAIAEKNGIPYLGVATALYALHQQGYEYYFSPFPKSPDIAKSVYEMLDGLIDEGERPLRVGIFQETTDWGEELGALWVEEAANYGYEIVLHETYAPLTEDFSDLILKAQEADVQALLSLPIPPDGFTMYRQMGELGWKPPFSLVVRAADVPTWNDLGDVGDGVLLSAGWHPDLAYPGTEPMNNRHIEEEGRPADPIVGGAYSLVQILADAIERAGTLDHDAIRDAIRATDLMTVAGQITFNEDGTSPIDNPLMQRQDGIVVLVWPADRAPGTLVYPAN